MRQDGINKTIHDESDIAANSSGAQRDHRLHTDRRDGGPSQSGDVESHPGPRPRSGYERQSGSRSRGATMPAFTKTSIWARGALRYIPWPRPARGCRPISIAWSAYPDVVVRLRHLGVHEKPGCELLRDVLAGDIAYGICG